MLFLGHGFFAPGLLQRRILLDLLQNKLALLLSTRFKQIVSTNFRIGEPVKIIMWRF